MSTALPLEPLSEQSNSGEFDLVEMLLREQQSLSAVEQFSAFHSEQEHTGPAQEKYYQRLLPASPPGPGQQFAFHVDMDSCSGCKSCVVACHTLNGLEEDESWRRVGTLTIGGDAPKIQHVTTACHHCDDPGCLNGCPVKAYDKDPVTGVVRHLDDQCIGCKYCTMMCPYEVPKYSKRLGIVRKCDMCHQRLSSGEAPACVQSCPNEAISIRIVETSDLQSPSASVVPGAPSSSITLPSTTYESAVVDQDLVWAQDHHVDEVAESHWPLAAMLVATQASVGMLLVERLVALTLLIFGSEVPLSMTRNVATLALLVGFVGMNLAPLHLGQPLRAWRVFLGLRTSWLSREAVVLGKFVGALVVAVILLWLPTIRESRIGEYLPSLVDQIPSWASKAAVGSALLIGVVGLYCSAMIYIATKRQLWRFDRTNIRFFGTAIVCGLAGTGSLLAFAEVSSGLAAFVLIAATVGVFAKIGWEWRIHLGAPQPTDDSYDQRCRRLVQTKLRRLSMIRILAGVGCGALLFCSAIALMIASPTLAAAVAGLGLIGLLAAEFAERILYFCSVVYDRMPGALQ